MATIKDIADAVGVSIGTVDRIIHNRGRFSEQTAEKVRRAIKDMDYSPNIHARGLKKSGEHRFAAVLPDVSQDAGYWRMVAAGIERASVELGPLCSRVGVYHFDRYSTESSRSALKAALADNPDGMLVAPVFPDELGIELAESGVPFLFIDSDLPDVKKRISYIGQDSFQSGVLSAKLMSMMIQPRSDIKGSLQLLVIEPPGNNYHLQSRIDGFNKYIEEQRSDIECRLVRTGQDDEEGIHQKLQGEFGDGAIIPDGIFAANSSVYYVASFLRKKGPAFAAIPLIGYDLIPERQSLIEDETINFILTQQPEEQAYRGILMLYDVLVLKKDISREIIIPLNIITKENLHTFSGSGGGF